MATPKLQCQIGNDNLYIRITWNPLGENLGIVQSDLQTARNGIGQVLYKKVVGLHSVRSELEVLIGRAWHWFKMNGVRLSSEEQARSAETIGRLMEKLRQPALCT